MLIVYLLAVLLITRSVPFLDMTDWYDNASAVDVLVQILESDGQSALPLEVAVAEECRKQLPSDYEMRWCDLRFPLHYCMWLMCDLLQRLRTTQLPAVTIRLVLSDALHMLTEVACHSENDVGVTAVLLSV